MIEVFQGADPVMIFLFALMAVFATIAVVSGVMGIVVSVSQWLRGTYEPCGWAGWWNPNNGHYCKRRMFHRGQHR